MRSLHPRPYSGFDNRIEKVGETANSLCLYLFLGSFFALLLMNSHPYKREARIERSTSHTAVTKQDECFKAYGIDCGTYNIILGQSMKETRQEEAKAKKEQKVASVWGALHE